MKWKRLIVIIIASPILLLLLWFMIGLGLIPKIAMSLKVNGKTIGVARESFIGAIRNNRSASVYIGNKKIFSLREDFFDEPVFVYPFADGKRFLCDYDYDVAMLDFVVDFNGSATNQLDSSQWPLDNELRIQLARMATNVVFDTKGIVRLPSCAELQEVSSYLTGTSPISVKAAYFDFLPYWDKDGLLLDLATNRSSNWPTK
jgi:hypothetical protein